MVVYGAEHGVEARCVSDMAKHEAAAMACSLPQEQPETSGAGAACWGTCEELLLVSAVKRHGVNNWNLISSELKARAITLNVSPLYFSEAACKHKYDVLRGRFASCSSSTMSQDEEVGNDMHWFEELRKIRVAHLKRELEHYDGSIGSLQVKIKRLKAEKAGDISANKLLGKSIANPQPNDHVPEASSCEVPVQCSSIDGEFGNNLSNISSLKPSSHHLKASLALDTEKNLQDYPLIQSPVNLQHVIPECDQWHDAVEELKDASPGSTDITVDADVQRHLHQPHNTTEPSNLDPGVELDDGTVSLADTVTIEPQVISGLWVDELQGVEAAGVAASSQIDENMKIPGKSEQADTEQSKHLVDKSAESLSRDHEAGLLVLDSVNEDKAEVGVESLHADEQRTQELVQDESIIVQRDPRLEGDDRTLSATADAISNMDTCEDGGTVYPNDSDLRIHAVGHSFVSPNSSLLGPQFSGSMTLGEAGDKQPEIFTITEEKATPSNSQQNVYELHREMLENVVDNAIPRKETDSEVGLRTQSHAVLALDTEHDHNTGQIKNPVLEHDNMGDARDLHRIDESLSDLGQDAKVDEIISSEPLPEISKFHEDLPNVQVLKEVSMSGLESAGTGPESDTAAAEGVRNAKEYENLGISGVVPVVKCESWMRPDGAMIILEKPESEESAKSFELLYPSNVDLTSSSPEGRIVIALDEPNNNVPSCGSKSVPPISAEEKMMSKVDMYIGSDAVRDVQAESMEGKEQLIATSCQDAASGEYDGSNTAPVSSANSMELLREVYGRDTSSELPLIAVELVPKPEPDKTAATSEMSLPSITEASNFTNSGPATSHQVENGTQTVETTSKVVDQSRTSELDVETDLGQVAEDSEVGHIVENAKHIDSHAVKEEHLDTGVNQLVAGDACLTNAKAGLPSSHSEESVSPKLVTHHTEEEHHQRNNGRKNVKESPLAAVLPISGSLPVDHTEIDPASDHGSDSPEFQVASIDIERKLQGIILDVKLEISKEESLEVQTSVSKQLSEVISEGSRGRDLDISSLSSPNAVEGRDQSDRGLVMESTELKPLTTGPAKVKEEIIDYVTDGDLQEIRGSAPKSGINPKAEPSSPDESLAGGLESKVPSSHEGSDSVQEQYKDGGDQSGEGEERRQRVRDYGESQIDKSEAGSPVDGNDEMSPSSRRNRREPRVPGKLVPLLEVLRNICNHKSAYLFKGRPEDPRYNLLIRRHLDLTIVRARLEEGAYSGSSEYFRDLLLIFNNAMVFYPSGSTEFLGAKALFAEATKELDRICQTEALLKRDGPATRTRELKKPKTVAGVVTPSPIGGVSSGKLVGSNPSVTSLPDNGSRKRASTRLGTLETSTNSESVVDSECGAARSASVNIFGGPSTSRAEEARDSRDDDQEVNGSLKGGKKLHVGGGSSRRIARQEELQEEISLKNGVNKASGRAKLRDVKDAEITKGPALSSKAAVGAKLRAERETERKREKEQEKEKDKVKIRERDDIDDDDFLLRKGKSLAKLKDQEIVQERISDTKPASKARTSTAVRSNSNSQDTLAQSIGRPVRGARKSASSAKEPGRLPEQQAKKRARK